MTRVAGDAETETEKSPFSLVVVPVVLPLTVTEAPASGWLLEADTTFPLTW